MNLLKTYKKNLKNIEYTCDNPVEFSLMIEFDFAKVVFSHYGVEVFQIDEMDVTKAMIVNPTADELKNLLKEMKA